MRSACLVTLALLAGCFDSLVSGPCAAGYDYIGSECIAREELADAGTGRDAPVAITGDAPPPQDAGSEITNVDASAPVDAGPVCMAPEVACGNACVDLDSSPANCGGCGHVCTSGICVGGACVGQISGHIVAIGHDYQRNNGAMLRVLGNAIALGANHDVGLARLSGTSTQASQVGTSIAISVAMMLVARPFHTVAVSSPPTAAELAAVDVLLVDAQTGDGAAAAATGAAWATSIDALLQRGGVVIVLEGASGVSYRFAEGAGLYQVGAPVDATGAHASVTDWNDAIVQQVASPYLADTSSVVFPGAIGPISTASGALALHRTRY